MLSRAKNVNCITVSLGKPVLQITCFSYVFSLNTHFVSLSRTPRVCMCVSVCVKLFHTSGGQNYIS